MHGQIVSSDICIRGKFIFLSKMTPESPVLLSADGVETLMVLEHAKNGSLWELFVGI